MAKVKAKKVTKQKEFMTAAMLSFTLGWLGVDRFYMGYKGLGILKMITLGGFGVWYWVDLVLIYVGVLKDKQGRPLAHRDRDFKKALIIAIAVYVVFGVINTIVTVAYPNPNSLDYEPNPIIRLLETAY